ncbi:hypothetical protein [Blastomonas sp.]|uniref:hypothetical protein n=1 Tax=Blastomonas sp. TaxID=1909299 RepID=UPI00391C166E
MTLTSRQTGGPLPTSPENAAVRDGCLECEAWQAREIANSDGAASRSATEGAAPASAAPEAIPCSGQLSIRERAFDAAQRLVLSQPHMAIGQLEQNRMADYILELAARFNAWMLVNPEVTVESVWSGWDYSK